MELDGDILRIEQTLSRVADMEQAISFLKTAAGKDKAALTSALSQLEQKRPAAINVVADKDHGKWCYVEVDGSTIVYVRAKRIQDKAEVTDEFGHAMYDRLVAERIVHVTR